MNDTQDNAPEFRNKRKARFTQVGNAALLDCRLSMSSKGLLAIMLSRPDDWAYNMPWLEKQSTDSMYALRKALRELVEAGYVVRTAKRGEKGRVHGWEYAVSDDPADLTDFTNYRKTAAPTYGESHATNTDSSTNTDLDQEKDGAENRAGQKTAQPETNPPNPDLPPVSEKTKTAGKGSRQDSATTTEDVPRGAALPVEIAIPDALRHREGFAEAWGEWVAYRKARRLSCLPVTLKAQLGKLEREPDPVAVIEQSITNGWNGLFPLKGGPKAGKPRTQAEANERFIQGVQDTMSAVKGVFDD